MKDKIKFWVVLVLLRYDLDKCIIMSAQSAILFPGLFSCKPEWGPGNEAVQSEYTTMTANKKDRVTTKIITCS